jgi:MipA family protein
MRFVRADRFSGWLLLAGGLLALAQSAPAQTDQTEECRGPSQDCAVVGKWIVSVALGAGEITNPLHHSENIPLIIIPHVSYYGKRVFLDDLDVGITFLDTDAATVSLVATPDYDRVYFYRLDPQNFFLTGVSGGAAGPANAEAVYTTTRAAPANSTPLPPRARHFTYLAGPEFTFKSAGITGQIDVLREITDQDNGDEVRAALGIPLFKKIGLLSTNLGITWKSSAIVNYYYGEPGVYSAGSAFDPFVKLAYTLPLSSKWRFDAFVQYERLGNAIANSPIVAEHTVATMFVGAIYTF